MIWLSRHLWIIFFLFISCFYFRSFNNCRGYLQSYLKKTGGGVCKKYQKGLKAEEVADMLEEDVGLIRKLYELAEKYAPDFDYDAMYEDYEHES